MKKSLYLGYEPELKIDIDGPSLLIRKSFYSPIRLPFRILERVYIRYDANIGLDLLFALLENNIPVVFISKEICGYFVLPLRRSQSGFNERLKNALYFYEWRRQLVNWFVSSKRKNELIFIRRYAPLLFDLLAKRGYKKEDFDTIIKSLTSSISVEYYEKILRYLYTIHSSLVLAKIMEYGLDPQMGIVNRMKEFGLVNDISDITMPDLLSIIVDIVQSPKGMDTIKPDIGVITSGVMKYLTDKYESRRESIQFDIESTLGSLFEFLREIPQ